MSGIIEQERYTCAIGMLQSVVAVPRAVPILHSGPDCGNMVQGFFERSTGYAGDSTSPCINFTEKEVVFDGTDRLRENIVGTYKILDTDLQVVLTGCIVEIVGDDIESVVEEFREDGKSIVSMETAGFKCNNFEAHSLVVNAVIDQYVSHFKEENPFCSEKNTVNLFASLPYQDPFWKGDLRGYKRPLEGIGFSVHVLFGPESGDVREWQQIPKMNFNILISPQHGLSIAEHLEEVYGQPFTQYPNILIGANKTERFLRQVLAFANEQGAKLNLDAVEKLIQQERKAYYEEIDNLATFLLEFRYGLSNHVRIVHDAGYVLGLSKFLLHGVGIVPKEQFTVDNIPKRFQEQIAAGLQSTSDKKVIPLTFEPDAGKVQDTVRSLHRGGRGLIIGSGWDKELTREKDYDFLSASVPTPYRLVMTTNYVGSSGGLRVIEDIYDTVLATYR